MTSDHVNCKNSGERKRKSTEFQEQEANLEAKLLDVLNANCSVKLAALVLNRGSFPQTVDNLFALSILVRQGRAAVTVSEDQTRFVAPRTPSEDENVDAQFVYRCDIEDWELMKTQVESGEELMEQTLQSQDAPLQWSLKGIRKKARKKTSDKIAAPGKYVQVVCQLNTSSLDGLYCESDEETISETLQEEALVDISGFESMMHPSDHQAQSFVTLEGNRSGFESMDFQHSLIAFQDYPEQDGGFETMAHLQLADDSQCLSSSEMSKLPAFEEHQGHIKRENSESNNFDELFSKPRRPRLLTYSRRPPKDPEVPQTTLEMIKHYTRQALSTRSRLPSREASVLVFGVPKKKRTNRVSASRANVLPNRIKAEVPKAEPPENQSLPSKNLETKGERSKSLETKEATIMLKRFKRFKTSKPARKMRPRQALIAQVKARLKAIFKPKGSPD